MTTANQKILGIDIGGANLKVASANGKSISVPFELWRRPQDLAAALTPLLAAYPTTEQIALTMTGELCDCFATKREGVETILAAVERACEGRSIQVWGTDGKWHSVEESRRLPMIVAAANWHGLATFAGRYAPTGSALLIDTGSTTTDIIPLKAGKPNSLGKTDPERLASGELVYTGVRRTPLCAILQDGYAAEWFATSADVYIWLGLLAEDANDRATADGRPATKEFAHARLSRMLGGDPEIISQAQTQLIAQIAFVRQQDFILRGIESVCNRFPEPIERVILSGSGEFLAHAAWQKAAKALGNRWKSNIEVVSLTKQIGNEASSAACAFALAALLDEAMR